MVLSYNFLYELERHLLRPHSYGIVGPGLSCPNGVTTLAHFEAAADWEDRWDILRWACENGATVAEMRVWRRAMRGEDLSVPDDIEITPVPPAIQAEIERLRGTLATIREKLKSIVCTEGDDKGVVLLSLHGPTHLELIDGEIIQVYDNEYFSPLGDALMELYRIAERN